MTPADGIHLLFHLVALTISAGNPRASIQPGTRYIWVSFITSKKNKFPASSGENGDDPEPGRGGRTAVDMPTSEAVAPT